MCISGADFSRGCRLVNMLPGATATQLGIFLGTPEAAGRACLARRRVLRPPGLLRDARPHPGLCRALASRRSCAARSRPRARGARHIPGRRVPPRPGAASTIPPGPAHASPPRSPRYLSPLGVAAILLLAGGMGLLLFHSTRLRSCSSSALSVARVRGRAAARGRPTSDSAPATRPGSLRTRPGLADIGAYFFKVGALTVGGGLTMIAIMQDQVARPASLAHPLEFVDGLALGSSRRAPSSCWAAYVGGYRGGRPRGSRRRRRRPAFLPLLHPHAGAPARCSDPRQGLPRGPGRA